MESYLETIQNENTKKAFMVVMMKLREYEQKIGKLYTEFTKDDIDNFIKTKYRKTSETTLANTISHLKNLYKFIDKEEIVEHLSLNYIREITLYKKHEFYSPDEIKSLVEQLHNAQDKALVMLVYLGLYDENFDTIRHLKESQIKDGYIELDKNKKIVITDYIQNILYEAMNETFSYKYIERYPKDINAIVQLKENTGYLFRAKKIKNAKKDVISVISLKKKFGTFAKYLREENFSPITIKNSKIIYDLVKMELESNNGFDINQIELKRICKEENKKNCIEQLNVNKKEIKNKIIREIFNNKDLFVGE